MLQIESFCAETAEHQTHEGVFCCQKKDGCYVEDQDNATGEINQAEDKEECGCNQCGNGYAQDDGSDLPDQFPCTGSVVKAKHGKDEEEHQGISYSQQDRFCADRGHVFAIPVKEIQP